MNDLEKFLQQAAERLAKKLNEGQKSPQQKPPGTHRPPPRSVRTAERQPPRMDAEIIEAEVVQTDRGSQRRELGPDPLSNIDTRPSLAQGISQADERMAGHLQQVFDHPVSALSQAAQGLKPSVSKGETEKSIDIHRRQMDVSPLVKMLRQPDTLRAAFLASEIFKRKF